MAKKETSEMNLVTVNEKVRELNLEQARMVVVLMATGKTFAEAYEVAKTFGQQEVKSE